MMYDKALLLRLLEERNITISEHVAERLDCFAALLTEQNKLMNLTALLTPEDLAAKHFADSLTLLPYLPQREGLRLLDVGTGGGFPGIPLALARPDLQLTLLDSTRKKLDFLQKAAWELGLAPEIVHARAEEAGRQAELRETFDCVVSRAVAPLPLLCEYCLPFAQLGGLFLAMKGANAGEELRAAGQAIRTLGGEVTQEIRFSLGEYGERSIICIKKTSQTSTAYPRPSAQIAKKPL